MTHVYICQNHNLDQDTEHLHYYQKILSSAPSTSTTDVLSVTRQIWTFLVLYKWHCPVYSHLCLIFFTKNVFVIHPCYCIYQKFVCFYCQVVLHGEDATYYSYPFTCWIFPGFCYYDQSCYKHIHIDLLFSFLLGKYQRVESQGKMEGA